MSTRRDAHMGRVKALKSNAVQYGPLVNVELIKPYIRRFRREYGLNEEEQRLNEFGLRMEHVVGDSMARRMRGVMANEYEHMGLYKVDEMLCAMGYGSYIFHTDDALRRAFMTPEENVFA